MEISIQHLLKQETNDCVERAKVVEYVNTLADERNSIGESLKKMIGETNDAAERLDRQCKMLISTNSGMEEKIRKRNIDLERNTKRLEGLDLLNVRPAFMDEYEQVESELQVEYDRYVVRFRNVDYLEGELQSKRDAAATMTCDVDRSIKRMQKKFKEEELRVLQGGDGMNMVAHEQSSIGLHCKENSIPNGSTT